MVMVSAYAYSRYVTIIVSYKLAYDYRCMLTAIWGYNADDWLPERFLNVPKTEFQYRVHGCIGWKYSFLEVHAAILVQLLQSFEILESGVEVCNNAALVSLILVVEGREREGWRFPYLPRR
ncbi:hypothetical protein EDD18DRAFT_703392 [Armillaria luteobubalina]|uniref:Uncharacterized protein n=1 Tax=Armillaria luteobubalina TaxID=153913 RepID=A0AA39PJM4_9AGAR|nr:hypothetical protein EDD18DRAFT_703392 [Armillaria luteobubalina]